MDNCKIPKELGDLKELYQKTVPQCDGTGMYEVTLQVENPQQHIHLVNHLIRLCVLSLEHGEKIKDRHIPDPLFSVTETLRMILDIMPQEHLEFFEEFEKFISFKK